MKENDNKFEYPKCTVIITYLAPVLYVATLYILNRRVCTKMMKRIPHWPYVHIIALEVYAYFFGYKDWTIYEGGIISTTSLVLSFLPTIEWNRCYRNKPVTIKMNDQLLEISCRNELNLKRNQASISDLKEISTMKGSTNKTYTQGDNRPCEEQGGISPWYISKEVLDGIFSPEDCNFF